MPKFCSNCGHPVSNEPDPNTPKMLVDDQFVFSFGKHRGLTARQVMNTAPQYLFWVNQNIEWLEVDPVLLMEARKIKPAHPGRRPPSGMFGPRDDYDGHDLPDDDIPF